MFSKIRLVASLSHGKSAAAASCARQQIQMRVRCDNSTCRWSGQDEVIQQKCAWSEHLANQPAVRSHVLKSASAVPSASSSLLKPTTGGISFPPRPKSATNRPASAFRSCYWAKNYRLGDLNSEPAVNCVAPAGKIRFK